MYWVSMTDKFMSGWGEAHNKVNKLVIECQTWEQAQIVERNAKRRHEMKYVNICINKPYYDERCYYVNYHGQGDYDNRFTDHPEWK